MPMNGRDVVEDVNEHQEQRDQKGHTPCKGNSCLLYTSDAADE